MPYFLEGQLIAYSIRNKIDPKYKGQDIEPMNGDGESSTVSGVDGQNITPSTITTGAITSTSLTTGTVSATGNIETDGEVGAYNIDCVDIAAAGLSDLTNLIVSGTSQLVGTTTASLIQAVDIDVSNNISALSFGATNGFFEEVSFISGRRAPSVLAPPDYILPITAPPNDGNTYGIGNQPTQSTITTPVSGSVFSMDVQYLALPVERVDVPLLPGTVLTSDFVFQQINEALAAYFDRQGSPRDITFSLDVSSFPYRTAITIVGGSYSIRVFVSVASGIGPLLGWGATSAYYISSTTSPSFSTFTALGAANPQLTWTALTGTGTSGSVGSRIQNATGTVYVECEADRVDVVGNLVASADVYAQTMTLAKLGAQAAPVAGRGLVYADTSDRLAYITSTQALRTLAFTTDVPAILRAPDGNSQIQTGDGGVSVIFNNSTSLSVFSSSIAAGSTTVSSPNSAASVTVRNAAEMTLTSVSDIRLVLAGAGLRINSYYIPPAIGTIGTVLTSNGTNSTWASPGIFSATATATVTNTTAETTIINATGAVGSLTIPANFFGVGSTLQAAISGGALQTNGANRTLRIRIKMAGVTVCDSGIQTLTNLGTPVAWSMTVNSNYNGTTLQTNLAFHYGLIGVGLVIDGTGAFNPAIANLYDITVTWGNGSPNNVITSSQCVLRRLY